MADQDNQDKQLPASERKLKKAREEGQIVRSRDLGHFLVILSATMVLVFLTPWWMERLSTLMSAGFRFDARTVATPAMMLERLGVWSSTALLLVVPMGLGIAIAAAASSVMAGGWVMSFKIISPKFSKLNPINGIGNVFSKQQMVDALKASLLALILGAVGATLLWKNWPDLVQLLNQPLPTALGDMGSTTGWPATRTTYAAPLLALAWAVHPLQVSSVLYIVQRMQTMGTLFLVLALCAYLKMRHAQIAGERSRQYGVLAVLCWVLALASKEDAILLPAYTLALELTVLRFRTASAAQENRLRRGYQLLVVLGVAVFVLVLVPKHWYPDSYPGRDFSSLERLLTQGRVLAMYLGQVLCPLPSHLPFYYDDLQPSRSLLQPWTTLPALLLVFGLLALAWRLRHRRPLLSLGILLFFAGHAVSSNIIGLELAFEHRNHFPLIGAVLALGDLLWAAFGRLQLKPGTAVLACVSLIAALSSATVLRAQAWGSRVGFAEYGTRVAPGSERAWIDLCQTHFELSENRPSDPHFAKALATCAKGATLRDGATNLTNLVLLKTIDGSVRQSDWEQLFERMRRVTLTPSNVGVAWHLARYSNGDKRVEPRNVIAIIDIIGKRSDFRPEEYAAFGYYAAKNGLEDDAFRYFVHAVEISPPNSTLPEALIADLRREGYPAWAERLIPVARAHRAASAGVRRAD